MLQAETERRLRVEAGGEGLTIDDLVLGFVDQRGVVCGELGQLLWEMQEEALSR